MQDSDELALLTECVKKSFEIGKTGRQHLVLDGVSIHVARGEWVALMGASGSGKTTFLKCASGILKPDSGKVFIGDANIEALSEDKIALMRRTILAYVFQEYNILEELTVEQNIALPIALNNNLGVPDRVAEALSATGITHLAGRLAGDLSGGEKQRVAIARAVAQRPTVLFADEPTGALDSRTSRSILELFRELANSGIGILMVTHDLFAASQADRVVVLRDGAVASILSKPTEEALFAVINRGEVQNARA